MTFPLLSIRQLGAVPSFTKSYPCILGNRPVFKFVPKESY